MALETYVENNTRNLVAIRLNVKQKKLIIPKTIGEKLAQTFGPFDYVLFKFDPEVKDSFWLTPCSPDELGSRHMLSNGKSLKTRYLKLTDGLVEKLELKSRLKNIDSKVFPGNWDNDNNAIKIDLD